MCAYITLPKFAKFSSCFFMYSVFSLSVSERRSACMSKFVSTVYHKLLVGVSPNLQLWCSWGQVGLITF